MKTLTYALIRAHILKLNGSAEGRFELTDHAERGAGRLCMIIRATGSEPLAEWYVKWHRDGKRVLTKLGNFRTLTLKDARQFFREQFAPAILAGKNPTGPREWTRGRTPTVGQLFRAYVDSLQANQKKPDSIRQAYYALLGPNGAAFAIGADRPTKDITSADIVPLLKSIKERGKTYQANSVRLWLRAAFEFARKSPNTYHVAGGGIAWGVVHNPVIDIATDPNAFLPRDRSLSREEFRRFWMWLTEKGSTMRYRLAPAIQLMMATGQRPTEILRTTPATYDPEGRTISWTTTKNGKPHCIPLPRQAVAILGAQLPNEHGMYFYRLFQPWEPARSDGVAALVERYLAETGAAKFVGRDLRRTWKTLAGDAGIKKFVRDKIQNHAEPGVSAKHYDKYDYLREMRAGMEAWERYLAELLTGNPDGTVSFSKPVRIKKSPAVVVPFGKRKRAA